MISKLTALLITSLLLTIIGFAGQSNRNNAIYPQYNLSVRLMPGERRLEAKGTVRMAAATIDRDSLELSLSELMEDFRVEVVSPVVSAGVARLDKSVRPYSRPGWGTVTWKISPPRPIPAGEPVVLRFSYAGGGERTSFIFSLNSDVCFGAGISTAWYPEVEELPLDSNGRLRGLRGTGSLTFSVPRGYLVHSPGIERSTLKETSQGLFRFQINNPVFFSFAAGRYIVRRKNGTLPVKINLLRARRNSESYIDGAARVLDVLTREFGRYPHSNFAVVEVPNAQADQAGFAGASVDGFIFANSEFLDKDFNTAYFGHEISHQWWGNLIRTKSLEGRWMLSEGMAQYGSLRAVEMIEGTKAAARYRRTGYPGYYSDQSAFGYFTLIKKGTDHRLSDLPPEGNLPHILSDSKGFIVLDMMSRLVGRKQFSQALQKLTRENAYQRIAWGSFLKAVEEETGRNLQWFFEQWFERTGAPDFQLKWEQKGETISGTITQPAPFFRSTLEVEIAGANNRRITKTIEIVNGEINFRWKLPFRATSVVLDPDYKVLRWTPDFRL